MALIRYSPLAKEHLGWKRQPAGGSIGVAISPESEGAVLTLPGSGLGYPVGSKTNRVFDTGLSSAELAMVLQEERAGGIELRIPAAELDEEEAKRKK